jgi:hypothetical protein
VSQVAPPVHWPRRTIYVVNHLPSKWPVAAAFDAWDRGGSVRLPRSRERHLGYPVLHLYASSDMPRDWGGKTVRRATDGVITYARVYMNTYVPDWADWYQRRAWLTHEIGHALGLNHDTRRSSVMATGVTGLAYPTAYDLTLLRNEYVGVRW